MVKKAFLTLVALAAVLAVVVAVQPAAFRIERSTTVAAAPPAVFAHVNDLHRWQAWSPWAGRDPAMRETYDGAPAGEGAAYAWAGNRDVGSGRMTIVESRPDEAIRIRLEFLDPFAATNTATFTFAPAAGGTRVTWAMDGENGFVGKAFALLLDMDAMVGADFEQGLAALRRVAEGSTQSP